ncbi:MAG: type II toxin-antitoxin system RelE/ParE family toxin [Bdellovibrio sp.]|nr:type II toxin-antitoxin system RelE/ParE family toxin [Bdellovibrio sp.]
MSDLIVAKTAINQTHLICYIIKQVPGNRLERLQGKLKGFYSIRINSQWRVIFNWFEGIAENIEIIDYH